MNYKLLQGNNLELLKNLEPNSIDSVVTDPPYGLSFMNKKWDYDVPSIEFWKEVYRVLKPGGHILSFGGTRTYHRLVVNIEDAGFEIRDQIQWIYGSGFPKSLNIGKSIDKMEGNERKIVGVIKGNSEWEGWGTALKPANEPICLARKPLSEKSVAENVLKWGAGGINIDGCRVGNEKLISVKGNIENSGNIWGGGKGKNSQNYITPEREGRFPANVILECICDESIRGHNDKGGASRFFYQAKVSKSERNEGLSDFEDKDSKKIAFPEKEFTGLDGSIRTNKHFTTKNSHPTVKPVNLMAYLCRLITPPNGVVLDPFLGSGSTGIAALLEGFNFIGMEMEEEYIKIAEGRISNYESYRRFLK